MTQLCRVDDCESVVRAAELCHPHYMRNWRESINEVCGDPDCERPVAVKSLGLCLSHYKASRLATAGPCRVIDCVDPVAVKSAGLCQSHYDRWRSKRGSRSFPGLGILACRACGRPYTSHDRWPCPAWNPFS